LASEPRGLTKRLLPSVARDALTFWERWALAVETSRLVTRTATNTGV